MSACSKLLVVDDALAMRLVLGQLLRAEGYEVSEATDGESALEIIAREPPALVVLDVNLPGISGFDVLARMRAERWSLPIILLTSYDDVEHRVRGLEAGADDYVGKGFDRRELVARVRALLRRAAPPEKARVLRLGATIIDLAAKRAERDGVPLPLTRTEFAMLECLARAAGRPVPREELLGAVWGYDSGTNTRTVETHIWRLRKKIGEPGAESRWLVNRSGFGYVLLGEAA